MADETTEVTEQTEQDTATSPAGAQNADKGGGSDATETEQTVVPISRFNELNNKLKALEAKQAKAEAAAQTAADEDLARKEEWKQLAETRAADLATLKTEKLALELDATRREVAGAAKLPPALALRIQGNTREEMEADATELAALVPEPAPSGTPFVRQGAGGKTEPITPADTVKATLDKRYNRNGTASS